MPRIKGKPLTQAQRDRKREVERQWRLRNREKERLRQRNYRRLRTIQYGSNGPYGDRIQQLKRWMEEVKSGPCMDCGQRFPACCMDFDHRPGEVKSQGVSYMFACHYSRERIEAEIAKCDLVCANCHRIRTRDRQTGIRRSASNDNSAL